MKYTCEICGCTLDDFDEMQKHERECAEVHRCLYNCTCEINSLISLSLSTPFLIVAEIPIVEPATETDAEAKPRKVKLEYFTIAGTELDVKKNRCILKVKNDEIQKPTGSKTKSN